MSDKSMWVKLPKGAQVTMSRTEYEATQRLGFLSKVGIVALVIFCFWLLGQGQNDDTHNKPQNTTTSTPRSVDHG